MLHVLKRALAVSRGVTNATRRMAAGWIFTLLAIASVPTALQPVYAESYPERPIKIVVPFSPGGPTDVVARLIAQSLSSGLGQNVVVENLAGAGGRIGAKAAASAQPDGYTLLLGGTNVNAMLGALYKNLGFDPLAPSRPSLQSASTRWRLPYRRLSLRTHSSSSFIMRRTIPAN